jgi:hypothetical protein
MTCLSAAVAANLVLASTAHAQDEDDQTNGTLPPAGTYENGQTTGTTQTTAGERNDDRDDDRFGDAGQVAFSAERMFGVGWTWDSVDAGDEDLTNTTFNLSVLSNPLANVTNTYSFPRVGIDYFIVDNISIGAALGFAYASFDPDEQLQAASPFDSVTAFLAAPRVGYAMMFGDHIGIWPRVGVTWINYTFSGEGDAEESADRFALTGELPFVIQPTDNAAFLIGPTIDLGLSGKNRLEGAGANLETDVRTTELGVQFGLMVFFD